MLVILRHASAGNRDTWAGSVQNRPLDRDGAATARRLADRLGRIAPRARVLSSPAVRCTQTVAPYAARLGRRIEELPGLALGAAEAATRAVITSVIRAGGPAVICLHRENLPTAVLAACTAYGIVPPPDPALPKGGYWVIHGGTRPWAERG